MIIVHLLLLFVWAFCLAANIRIAKINNRNVALWVVLGIFFSGVALIVNVLLDPCEKKDRYKIQTDRKIRKEEGNEI